MEIRGLLPVVLMIAAALAYTSGGVCMKYSFGLTRPLPTVLLFTLFLLGAGLQALAMRSTDMGVAYILVLGLESLLAFIFSIYFFNEVATMTRVIAVFLITMGIILLHE
jgi:small multidrug resistance pump/quaternary ammonium compound-resistance protein SugE